MRERARLEVQEQELSHLLAEAVRQAECNFEIAKSRYNTLHAAQAEVTLALAAFPLGRIPYSDVLSAVSRRSDAESDFFRAAVNYQRALVQLHLRQGTLLEFNQVYLAEADWPGLTAPRHCRYEATSRRHKDLNYGLFDPRPLKPDAESLIETAASPEQGTTR